MEKLSKEKFKEFISKVSLEKLFSGESQKALATRTANERMEEIVKKIAEFAKQSGVPAEALKRETFEFETKKDSKSGKTKLSKLTRIESLSKKVNKEFEEKHPEAEKLRNSVTATVHLTKSFLRSLLAEKNKEKQVLMMQDYLKPELISQGFTDELLNKPIREMNFDNIPRLSKKGEMPFLECISRLLVEDVLKSRNKALGNENNFESDFTDVNMINKKGTYKADPENKKDEAKENGIVNESAEAINDMVTGGDSYDVNEKQNGEMEMKSNKPKNIEDMTEEEQIDYLESLGMLPPGLRKN